MIVIQIIKYNKQPALNYEFVSKVIAKTIQTITNFK